MEREARLSNEIGSECIEKGDRCLKLFAGLLQLSLLTRPKRGDDSFADLS